MAEAIRRYRLAAEQGDVGAQFQGDIEAQYSLGRIYRDGEGVPRDDVQAMRWFRLAADQGMAEAEYSLALMYFRGEGAPRDEKAARQWYELATAQAKFPPLGP
jgi:hypothetical protein